MTTNCNTCVLSFNVLKHGLLNHNFGFYLHFSQLFTFVNESRLDTGTYPSMRVMLELFNPYIGQPDPDIDNEIELFLFELLKTESMLVAFQYLSDWGMVKIQINAIYISSILFYVYLFFIIEFFPL